MKKTCCFTGHRNIKKSLISEVKKELEQTLRNLINEGFDVFRAGGALGFDTLAAQTVLELKKEYPTIRLILDLPCRNQSAKWKDKDVKIYESIKSNADEVNYISEEYTENCMKNRNHYLVDNSSICICYKNTNIGGTAYTVRYAESKGLIIINIFKKIKS